MKIYKFLRSCGKSTVSAIVNVVKLTQPTVSYHLKEMKDAGLLDSSKVGKEVYYSIRESCPTSENFCVLSGIKFPGK